MRKERYEFLDGMRGVAAIAVMLFHGAHEIAPQLAPGGYLAVDLFFCLSGFVIAHAYDERLAQGLRFADFARARLIRLWPMYVLGAALGALFGLAALGGPKGLSPGHLAATAALSAVFLPTWGYWLYPFDGPAWSLILELAANAAYALGFRRLTLRRLLAVAALAAVALAAFALARGHLNAGASWKGLPLGLARVAFSFSLGVVIHRQRDRLAPGLTLPGPVLTAAMLAVFLAPIPQGQRGWLDALFVLAISPALVLLGARARSFPGARALGDLSYPLYAIHFPALGLAALLAGENAATVAWTSLLLVPASLVLARALDAPLRARLSRLQSVQIAGLPAVSWRKPSPARPGRSR